VPSFEGHIYVIDGLKKCAERIDIGEHIYSTPLMDDVTGKGCLYVYMYVCVCVCVCICMYICIYVYMYICIYTYIYICLYVYVITYIYVYICIYVYMYIHIHMCIYIYMLIGNGYLDLVVGTLNGQVHLLETTIPYHPVRDIYI
jgi:hypothetical protein